MIETENEVLTTMNETENEVKIERDERRIKLMIAWCLLGLASWIQTNGIFQELPAIARNAPEVRS